jgi:hypothetical protein
MNQPQRPVRLLVLILTIFLVSAASCVPLQDLFRGLRGATDDAGKVVAKAATPEELRASSTKIDDYLKDVPKGTSLTPEQQAARDLAAQRSDIAKEIADMLGVADRFKALITEDSVFLVTGSTMHDPGPKFRAMLDEAAEKALREATCSIAADEADRQLVKPESPLAGSGPKPYAELTAAIENADYLVSSAEEFVDIAGLSSNILSTASGYVDKVKQTVSASAWNNGGAFQAYIRFCVLR